MSERKTHLVNGILIGMGTLMVFLGFFGWFSANYLFGTFSSILQECGIDVSRHYIFFELSDLRVCYVLVAAAGVAFLLVGTIREKLVWKKGV
jgi:hypothetical protein